MLAKEITSLQHPIVKNCVKLRISRKYRYIKRQIVLSGYKLVKEAPLLDILFLKKGDSSTLKAKETFLVTAPILKKMSGIETPEPIVAIAPMPMPQSLEKKTWILTLDGVSDPGNLGTLLRTALGLGWEGVFLTTSCVDPYNDKALRAAKGATFHLPMQIGNEEDILHLAKGKSVWIADTKGEPLPHARLPSSSQTMLILGNESHGVSQNIKKPFSSIAVPIQNVESLNVAAAGAILLYVLKK